MMCVHVHIHVTAFWYTEHYLLRRAEDNYEKVKAQYGASSCYLLKVNSVGSSGGGSTAPPGPDLWADYLGPREQGEVGKLIFFVNGEGEGLLP